jgi:membrane protein DedA with SNARE-associated domain
VALGAFLAYRGEVSPWLLGVSCWMANVGSAAWMYFFARAHGAAFFRAGWGRKLMPPEAMAALEEAYQRYGVVGIFLSRFLPGLRAAVTPFAGVVGLAPARALVPAALASGIWYAFLIVAGTTLAHNWEAVKALVGGANRVLGLLALVSTVFLVLWLWRRTRRS